MLLPVMDLSMPVLNVSPPLLRCRSELLHAMCAAGGMQKTEQQQHARFATPPTGRRCSNQPRGTTRQSPCKRLPPDDETCLFGVCHDASPTFRSPPAAMAPTASPLRPARAPRGGACRPVRASSVRVRRVVCVAHFRVCRVCVSHADSPAGRPRPVSVRELVLPVQCARRCAARCRRVPAC
jgi:hypothetical protein